MVYQVINSADTHSYNGLLYKDHSFDYNFHNTFEITYVIKGYPIATVNNTAIPLSEGDFLLVAPNIVHSLCGTEDCMFFTGDFSPEFIPELLTNNLTSTFYKFKTDKSTETFLKDHLIYIEAPEFYTLKACLYAICGFALSSTAIPDNTNINPSFFRAVNDYIAENLKNDISRKDIAAALNYEEHYFSTLFKSNFNVGFCKYINICRFHTAQKLISGTKLTITEIAHECGYKSIQTFNRVFKKLSGKTPTEYRNSTTFTTESVVMNQKIVLPTQK